MRVVFNVAAFYELRRDPGVIAELESHAERICARANAMGKGTYATGSRQGMMRPQGRWRASVVTADAKAIADNAKNHTLIRAMSS
ncbi:hypothetical protein GCM10009855_37050 [Gordonia cholesterolivorans]|uniref:Uncharacterized protein n=2 Tax=Gordonia cholesterolivorans TaxID=559625 RepID=A0ABN3I3T6_9ACTN